MSSSGTPYHRTDHTPSPPHEDEYCAILEALTSIQEWLLQYGHLLPNMTAKIEDASNAITNVLHAYGRDALDVEASLDHGQDSLKSLQKKLRGRLMAVTPVYETYGRFIDARRKIKVKEAMQKIESLKESLGIQRKKKIDLFKIIIERKSLKKNDLGCSIVVK